MHKIAQVSKVREFLTGKLMATFLDMMTLAVLLPFLFYLNASLTLAGAGLFRPLELLDRGPEAEILGLDLDRTVGSNGNHRVRDQRDDDVRLEFLHVTVQVELE